MHRYSIFSEEYAAIEVIGAILLVVIAVVSFALIYNNVFPLPIPSHEPNVHMVGFVSEDGSVVLEHMGGEPLSSYEVFIDGVLSFKNEDDPWEIGEVYLPSLSQSLLDDEDQVRVTVYSVNDDGSKPIVFDGILYGEDRVSGLPILISSLQSDSTDEDLICFNYSISPGIPASTYIYNWLVDKGGSENSITDLLMPFNTDSNDVVSDYSGNDNNGTVNGAIWSADGLVGGGYIFDGDDSISLPYCYDGGYIDEITFETWIKTSSSSGTIATFFRDKYWEIGVENSKISWSTHANDSTSDTLGISNVDDDNWHYVAATYDSSTGDSSIYVDGILDINEHTHDVGEDLGSGDTPNGFIGLSTEVSRETIFNTSFETQDEKNNWKEDNETWGGGGGDIDWENLFYDDFEGGSWGDWNDGGWDCLMYSGGTHAHQGTYAVQLRDNSGSNSRTYSDTIAADTAAYTMMSIDFWWKAREMESGEDFWVEYYDGSDYHRLATIVIGTGQYSNNVFYHTVCFANDSDYDFTDQSRFTIQCDASSNWDYVYIDEIYMNATTGSRVDYDFDLRDSSALDPRTGTYSLGGSGDFDPDYAYFNRTGFDISRYTDVNLSIWYSYDSTESDDEFGLYYKDGGSWIPIFEILSPQVGDGNQLDWINVEVQIPDYIDNLVLQFMWSTSSTAEYVAIDDLIITGMPPGGFNYSGVIDEFRIYNRVLSPEQIYQNYLDSKDGYSDKSVIVSEETVLGDIWRCIVTPNDGTQDGMITESNTIGIITYIGGD